MKHEASVNCRWNYLISREFVQRKRYSIDIPEWARFQLDVCLFLKTSLTGLAI